MATGALLSTTASQQGETLPAVSHAVVLECDNIKKFTQNLAKDMNAHFVPLHEDFEIYRIVLKDKKTYFDFAKIEGYKFVGWCEQGTTEVVDLDEKPIKKAMNFVALFEVESNGDNENED